MFSVMETVVRNIEGDLYLMLLQGLYFADLLVLFYLLMERHCTHDVDTLTSIFTYTWSG